MPDTSEQSAPSATGQTVAHEAISLQAGATASITGRRQAFQDLRRQLSDEDLANPGVQKMLLEELERAEALADERASHLDMYHAADKKAAVLEERLKPATAIEVLFGVGVSAGSAIVGLAPLFWDDQPKGWLALVVGAFLVVGATVGRVVKR